MMLQLGARELRRGVDNRGKLLIIDLYRMIFSSGQLLLYRMTLTLGQLSWRPKNMVRLVNYRYVCTYITILSLCVSLLFEFISIFRNIIMDITRTGKKKPKND